MTMREIPMELSRRLADAIDVRRERVLDAPTVRLRADLEAEVQRLSSAARALQAPMHRYKHCEQRVAATTTSEGALQQMFALARAYADASGGTWPLSADLGDEATALRRAKDARTAAERELDEARVALDRVVVSAVDALAQIDAEPVA